MGVRLFAAIDVGSYELTCKIFEYSARNGMREIDVLRHRLDLGNDTFATGKVGREKLNELCGVLSSFKEAMEGYKVEAYRAYGTSAIRETENTMILLDQIALRTGIRIEVLSNSEQRFLDYKAIASKGEEFNRIIEKGTAILDIGGGSIQISLFDKDTLIATQNMRLGVLRLQERLQKLAGNMNKYEQLLEETIATQMAVFKKLYLKEREIENIIVVDDYVSLMVQRLGGVTHITYEQFCEYIERAKKSNELEQVRRLDMPPENIGLLFVAAVLIRRCMKMMGAKQLWVPGVAFCDGIGYEYGQRKGLLKAEHDFEQDIVACALNISKRYMGNKRRSETLENICLNIFDHMKKIHGLGKRERLLLRLATILHDCGKYISLTNLAECSYNIILSTEIIGLSHMEREIVANVVRYNHTEFHYYDEMSRNSHLDKDAYMTIAKLTAILKVANALDRSHKQKFKDIRVALRENTLVITVNTDEDITLEQGLFGARADFFEEVYSIRPIIKQKRIMG